MEPWQTIMLVGGIVVVSAVVLPRRDRIGNGSQGNDNQTVRNMETALEQFMENMEADNREIASLVSRSSDEAQAQAVKRDERIGLLEKRIAELEHSFAEQSKRSIADHARMPDSPSEAARFSVPQPINAAIAQTAASLIVTETNIPEIEEPSTPSIRSRYMELFDMYAAGKSIDAIAKKLGRNKGEIQLILQLSKQEEAARNE